MRKHSWIEVLPESDQVIITDLMPATWFNLQVTAQSDAGNSERDYTFSTLTTTGAKIPPSTSLTSDEFIDQKGGKQGTKRNT